jgi:hypothetical protein
MLGAPQVYWQVTERNLLQPAAPVRPAQQAPEAAALPTVRHQRPPARCPAQPARAAAGAVQEDPLAGQTA